MPSALTFCLQSRPRWRNVFARSWDEMPIAHGLPLPLHCHLSCSSIDVLSVFELYVLWRSFHCANAVTTRRYLSRYVQSIYLGNYNIGKRRRKRRVTSGHAPIEMCAFYRKDSKCCCYWRAIHDVDERVSFCRLPIVTTF